MQTWDSLAKLRAAQSSCDGASGVIAQPTAQNVSDIPTVQRVQCHARLWERSRIRLASAILWRGDSALDGNGKIVNGDLHAG